MGKFTFRLSDRQKFIVEKVSPRINMVTFHSNKGVFEFRLNQKDAKEVADRFEHVSLYGSNSELLHGEGVKDHFSIVQDDIGCDHETFTLKCVAKGKTVFIEILSKKQVKKMYKTMREVFEV